MVSCRSELLSGNEEGKTNELLSWQIGELAII